MSPHVETQNEQQLSPDVSVTPPDADTGIAENEADANTEDEKMYRSRVDKAVPADLDCMYDKGQTVYFCPEPKNRKKQEGPYRIVSTTAGPRGGDPLYYLKWEGKGPGRDIPQAPETNIVVK